VRVAAAVALLGAFDVRITHRPHRLAPGARVRD
jgi:hypothetical protein